MYQAGILLTPYPLANLTQKIFRSQDTKDWAKGEQLNQQIGLISDLIGKGALVGIGFFVVYGLFFIRGEVEQTTVQRISLLTNFKCNSPLTAGIGKAVFFQCIRYPTAA